MAKTNPTDAVEDATVRSDKRAEPALAAALRDDFKTMLDVSERCMRWSRQAQVAQAEVLDGLATAMATAASSIDGRSDLGDMMGVADKLWRSTFEEMRRHGDLPYSFASLNFDVLRAWLSRIQDDFSRTASVAVPSASVDPSLIYDQARASLDQWMKQWSVVLQPRSEQSA